MKNLKNLVLLVTGAALAYGALELHARRSIREMEKEWEEDMLAKWDNYGRDQQRLDTYLAKEEEEYPDYDNVVDFYSSEEDGLAWREDEEPTDEHEHPEFTDEDAVRVEHRMASAYSAKDLGLGPINPA